MQHHRRHGTVNTATHRYQYFPFPAHNPQIYTKIPDRPAVSPRSPGGTPGSPGAPSRTPNEWEKGGKLLPPPRHKCRKLPFNFNFKFYQYDKPSSNRKPG